MKFKGFSLDGLRARLYPAHNILGVFDVNKLFLLSVLGLTACADGPGVHGDWAQGARNSPYSVAEFRARAQRGEPGVFPAPSGYSIYTEQQRIAAGAASSDGVLRQGTASSRTGEFITANFAGATGSANSPYRANALVAAKQAGAGTRVSVGGQSMKVSHLDVGNASYAVFQGRNGRNIAAGDAAAMEAALPQLTGCSKAAGPFRVGPGGKSNTHMVYALKCS